MKIKFKEQQFQIDAVNSVLGCFKGQINKGSKFTLDRGGTKGNLEGQESLIEEVGFKNNHISLTGDEVLDNINKVQSENMINQSDKLQGHYNLTIEMETGERVIIVTGCSLCYKIKGFRNFKQI